MPLDNLNGSDDFQEVQTKLDAVIDDLNDNQIKWKIVNIGDWNMDSTSDILVAHGLSDYKKIRSVSVIVRDDSDAVYSNAPFLDPNALLYQTIEDTHIHLFRAASSFFDQSTFNATSYNRGFITIGYVE